jgi:RNA polymerase sigma-70 factor (ECF subfamily)
MTEQEFKSFYEQTHKKLWMYMVRMCEDAEIASDLTQEAYLRFLTRQTEDLEPDKQRPYLFAIATNLLRDHWRRRKARKMMLGQYEIDERQTYSTDTKEDVHQILRNLSVRQRSLLWLAYVEGYQHKEISTMLKVSERSVRVLLFRAKRRFMKMAGELGSKGGTS